jgi:hypothetical protein
MSFQRALAIAVLAAGPALASSISNEVSVGRTQSTPANPRAGSLSDSLNASLDLDDHWALSLGGMLTLEGQTPAAERAQWGTSASAVTMLSTGIEFDSGEHFAAGADFSWSPRSKQTSGTTLTITENGRDTTADALVEAQSGKFSAGFDVGYDTAGESNLEWAFNANISGTHFSSDQRITRVRTASGAASSAQQIRDYCNAPGNRKKCSNALLKALEDLPSTLDSGRISLGATATISQDTDVSLGADYYAYVQDPTQVGFYSVVAVGRSSLSGGNGIPIAPLRWLVRPEVLHRFGAFSAKLWVQGGHYVESAGGTTAGGGLKLQYKFSKVFRMWLTASGQNDVDDLGNNSTSGVFSLGAGYRF